MDDDAIKSEHGDSTDELVDTTVSRELVDTTASRELVDTKVDRAGLCSLCGLLFPQSSSPRDALTSHTSPSLDTDGPPLDSGGTVAGSGGTGADSGGTVAASGGDVAASDGDVAASDGDVAASGGPVAASGGPVAASDGTLAGLCATLAGLCSTLAVLCDPSTSPRVTTHETNSQTPFLDDQQANHDARFITVESYEDLLRIEEKKEKLSQRLIELENVGETVVDKFIGNSVSLFELIVPTFIIYQMQQVPCKGSFAFSVTLAILLLTACCSCGLISYHNLRRQLRYSRDFTVQVNELILVINGLLKPPAPVRPELAPRLLFPSQPQDEFQPPSAFNVSNITTRAAISSEGGQSSRNDQSHGSFSNSSGPAVSVSRTSREDFRKRLESARRTLQGLSMDWFRCHCIWAFGSTFCTALVSFLACPAITYYFVCRGKGSSVLDLPS